MPISRITCNGYRSLEDVTMPLGPLTAIVGPNGSGKTSLLRAMNLILGPWWPSLRSLRIPQDFTSFDSNKELVIEIGFDPPLIHEDKLQKLHEITALRFQCSPYKRSGKWGQVGDLHTDFKPIGANGAQPTVAVTRPKSGKPPEFEPLTVSMGLRDQARILFIDHRRSLAQHLPTVRGSVLSRLFDPVRKEFEKDADGKREFIERYEEAMEYLRTPQVVEIENTINETAKRMIGFLGSSAVEEIDIGFGIADPVNPFNSLRLIYREGDLEIPGDELGLGIQSAIVVGIFEALRQISKEVGTVVIEEPEMYLHPQAQRYFLRILTDLVDRGDCQVIYSTHSPIFADVSRFEAIRLVRKQPTGTTRINFISADSDISYLDKQRRAQKIGIRFDTTASEVLFARKALLVEGPGDRLAACLVAELLGEDPDAEDLAIVACGAKTSIPFFARTCKALGIPFVVLHDEDIYSETGDEDKDKKLKEENNRACKENAEINEAVGDPSKIFILKPNLEACLGIGRWASDKPKRVVESLSTLSLEQMPEGLRLAVEELFK